MFYFFGVFNPKTCNERTDWAFRRMNYIERRRGNGVFTRYANTKTAFANICNR